MPALHPLAAPGKSDSNEQHSTVETIERLEPGELNGDDASEGAVRYNQARTLILLVAIVAVYFVQVLNIAGNGLLATSITTVTGGADKSIWLVSTFAISAAALGAPVSQAADYWGRKWFVVIFSFTGFIGCTISSRAHTFNVVIAGQSIACLALGAQPLVHAIASEIVPRKFRSFAQTAVNLASATGGIVGIMMGGALTRYDPEGFRIYFYITAGLYGAIGLVVTWLYRPPLRALQIELSLQQKLSRLDWFGYSMFVPGLILFSYALTSSSGVYPWQDSRVIGPLTVGAALLITFVLYECKLNPTGMLHHGLFSRGRNFGICLALIFTEGLAFFAANTYYAFEQAVLYERDFFHAGLDFTVVFWSANVATVLTGMYVAGTKTLRVPLVFATTCVTIFFASMTSLDLSTPWSGIGFAPFLGIGLGSALNSVIVAAQLSTPPDLIALASGLMIGMRSTGGTVGLSIFQALFSGTLGKKLPEDVLVKVVPLGFDPQHIVELLDSLSTGNSTLIETIPSVTPQIIAAAHIGMKKAYAASFRNVWIAAAAFAAAATALSCFIIDTKEEFTTHVDAPILTPTELRLSRNALPSHHLKGDPEGVQPVS